MPSLFCIPFTACNRQVDSLDRRQTNLQTVPSDIERYARTLEELLLDMNHIKELPKGLFRLQKLRRLGLSDNDILAVPPEVGSLVSLVELNLSRNEISDLPEQLRELKELSRLELSSNPFTRLPSAITLLSSLTYLGLNDVSLTQIPSEIGTLTQLRSLEVRENLLRTLPSSLCHLTRLQVLDLGQNEIDQLPSEIGALTALKELYVDANDLECLPDELCLCASLEQIDVSENKMMLLPEQFGDLRNLTDVNISQNVIQVLPSSIGRLRKLTILKAERNALTSLTPSIGSCELLQELFLTENLLSELPSAIGNLSNLKNLNVDKNQLTEIPTTIGGCRNLTVLSLRENQLAELPMDIGKCEKLSVVDLCSNKLVSLPFTINVLFHLHALWLSENQSQAMLTLNPEKDPRTGVKVLTCYLLPQSAATPHDRGAAVSNRSFVGGPKVHFGDQADTAAEEEKLLPIGQFERHDTPHPKPNAAKLKKNIIDGHVIHHDDEQPSTQSGQPATLVLKKKSSMESSAPSSSSLTATTSASSLPRSALRHGPQKAPATYLSADSSSAAPTSSDTQMYRIRVERDSAGGLGLSIAGGQESTPFRDDDRGIFVSRVSTGGPAERAGLRVGDKLLKVGETDVVGVHHETAVRAMQEAGDVVLLSVLRREEDTPQTTVAHHSLPSPGGQTASGAATIGSPDHSFSLAEEGRELISTSLKRDTNGSPGFAIAGGSQGRPGGDGFFISHITPNGAAHRDGKLQVGDRVLSIDGTKMRDIRHDQAVALLTGHPGQELHLVLGRDRSAVLSPLPSGTAATSSASLSALRTPSPASSPVYTLGDSSWDGKVETVEVVREGASLGLSVVGGADHASHPFGVTAPGVFISKIAANSAADRSRRLRIGDRILSVNDVSVKDATHAVAVDALKASGSRVRLVVSHDPQPTGLREVVVRRRGETPLGFSIHGGVGSVVPANPKDKRDEGIFIERVESGSVSESGGLVAGQRIVEVNGESLLGASQQEAAAALRRPHELRLLVCDGYNPVTVSGSSSLDQRSPSGMSAASPSSPILSSSSEMRATVRMSTELPCLGDSAPPLASSSPLPTPSDSSALLSASPLSSTDSSTKGARLPPPVAPKPAARAVLPPSVDGVQHPPENMTFNSKRSHFEGLNGGGRKPPGEQPLGIPPKKPLLNEQDIKRMKEEEAGKVIALIEEAVTPGEENGQRELTIIEQGWGSNRPALSFVRTKNAEQRAIATGRIEDEYKGLSEAERKVKEAAKRAEWREARLASLISTTKDSDQFIQDVIQPILNNNIEEEDVQNGAHALATEELRFADDVPG